MLYEQEVHSVTNKQRINAIDIIRGVAIMGILLVNGPQLNGPAFLDGTGFAFQRTAADIWYTRLIFNFAVGNFYPIFACLFGLSIAIFLADKPSILAPKLHLRRMSLLFLIGLAHAMLVWWGDILVLYSLLGTVLFFIYNKNIKFVSNILIFFISIALILSMAMLFIPETESGFLGPELLVVYQQGSFWAISQQRAIDFLGVYIPGMLFPLDAYRVGSFSLYYFQLAICFTFGFWLYRSNFIIQLLQDRIINKKTIIFTGSVSLLVFILTTIFPNLSAAFFVTKGLSRGLFYASIILFLYDFMIFKKIFYPFSCVGRMSLSNYLFHNICLSLIFYGYGLGFYGKIGPYQQAGILLTLMSASLILSSYWLKYFNFGPIEWLWRAGTYGYFSKLRKKCSSSELDLMLH